MDRIICSGSPHIKAKSTTRRIMIDVCIALLPACVMAVVFFGWNAVYMLVFSTLFAVLSEVVYSLIKKEKFASIIKQLDFTSVVTGMLIGLNMPPLGISMVYVPILASVFAIVVVKMLFGGTGRNIVNPAIAGRIFVFMSFTMIMTGSYVLPNVGSLSGVEVTSGATILTQIYNSFAGVGSVAKMGLTNLDLFLGTGVAGCIGETSKAALLLGFIYLVARGVLNIQYPVIYIVLTGVFTVLFNGFNFSYFIPSMLTGGLFLGAIFMATDYVTTPNTTIGKYIYFALLALLTAGLRQACKMETVSFAILLMNLLVPLMDKYIVPKPFGYKKEKSKKEAS